ncbi:hypothetical protein [Chryseobacterium sp.]|nr:hypothetical protein [Chryseobacterium sp.]
MNKDTATHSKVTGTDFEYLPTTDWKYTDHPGDQSLRYCQTQ